MFFITGDLHGDTQRIIDFCDRFKTTLDDVLIILGDVGINYYGCSDRFTKELISLLPITLFCIHGNHDKRPENVDGYELVSFCDGQAYQQKQYPNILFALDGEGYNFEGLKTIVLGGGYSVDKMHRLENRLPWFDDEQPNEEMKQRMLDNLSVWDNRVDIVLTHTTPYRYIPREIFKSCFVQSSLDYSTELFLDEVEKSVSYSYWYCGHYHIDKVVDRINYMFLDVKLLGNK
ncbi:MAG: metallophosphoesterase [Erysipelotrichaceae bacterium]